MDQNAIKNIADLMSLNVIFTGIFAVIVTWLMVRFLDYFADRLSLRFPRHRLQITRLFPIARLLIWTVALYVIIVDIINPPENTALAILASAGLAVGLAAQDTVRNIMSGILILFDQPFRVGDMIRVGEHYGEVVRIESRNTRLRTFDDNIVTFPNSIVWTQAVSNANSGNLDEMVVTRFSLPAYVDLQLVKDIAWEAAAASPYVYLRKPIDVLVEDEFDRTFLSSFAVKVYVIDVRYERLLSSDITENVKAELIKRGIIDRSTVMQLALNGQTTTEEGKRPTEAAVEKSAIILDD